MEKYTNSHEYDLYAESLMKVIIPTRDPHPLTIEQYCELRPEKIEYWDGLMQGDTETTMERFTVLLLYNIGLKKVLDRLPKVSKDELRSLLGKEGEYGQDYHRT